MARIEVDPNYSNPTFSRATAATDPAKKEDIQNLAAAMSTHIHDGAGKGLAIPFATAIPSGTITSAMIVDKTIVAGDIADFTITATQLATNAITQIIQVVGSTSGPTTSSSTFVDVPDMAITGTFASGQVLVWMYAALGNATAGAYVQVAMQLDSGADTLMALQMSAVANALGIVSVFGSLGNLNGAHTIKMRWATFGGGTATANGILRRMLAIEVKR